MDSYNKLPDAEIKSVGEISSQFLKLGIRTFKEACDYVHNIEYGYNTNYNDKLIFFKEKKGSCTSKHAVIAGLAEELNIPLYKHIGIYKLNEKISTGMKNILKKYDLSYVPIVHCFLVYQNYRFDLTEGNCNGKNTTIEEFIYEKRVEPFISVKNEYLLFKKILKEIILPSKEMTGVKERILLKAREESIILIKENAKKQKKAKNP